MEVSFSIGAKVSLKSNPSTCENASATSLLDLDVSCCVFPNALHPLAAYHLSACRKRNQNPGPILLDGGDLFPGPLLVAY